ncbi:MAG: hypothetical protein V4719_00250 [Planctomycetota bacterium]
MRKMLLLSLVLLTSHGMAAPPRQDSVTPLLGPKLFHDGDVIEITDVTATSRNLEPGDSVTVKGRARLESHDSANLSLLLTQTQSGGNVETDSAQSVTVTKGPQEFKLKITIKHRGVLHLTYYDPKTGKPFGGAYFGTADQMGKISKLDLRYYLE